MTTRKLRPKKKSFNEIKRTTNYSTNEKVLFKVLKILLIISLAYYLYSTVNVIRLLISGISWTTIRYRYSLGVSIDESLKSIQLLNVYIFSPTILYAGPAILLGYLATGKKITKSIKSIIKLQIFAFILYFFNTQGKIYLILALEYFIAIIFALPHKISKRLRNTVLIISITSILTIFLVIYLRSFQTGGTRNIIQNFYSYLVTVYPRMSYWIEVVDASNIYGYGVSFFSGIFNFFSDVSNFFGIPTLKNIQNNLFLISRSISTGLKIFENGSASSNTFVSAFFFFYIDFRLVGVFLGSTIFGFIAGKVEKNIYKNSILNYALYFLFLHNVIGSIVIWRFYITDYWIAYLYVFLLIRKNNKNQLSITKNPIN